MYKFIYYFIHLVMPCFIISFNHAFNRRNDFQIQLFNEQNEPFIPRPDTSVWASQRDYLHEDGEQALKEYNDARRETMGLLKNINVQDWERKARHAIFGPTNFFEIVSFMADHDRMHIQQAWAAMKKM